MQQASQPECPRRVFSELQRKLRRMTILVGINCLDGIILAADRRLTQNAQNEKEFDDHEGICKIVNLPKHKVAHARAGDYVSRIVGDRLAIELDQAVFDFTDIRLSLEKIAISTLKDEKLSPQELNEDRSLLVVFYGNQLPELQLWRLRITPQKLTAEPIVEMTIGGSIGNRVRFFEHYFTKPRSVDALTFLAAHIVLTAGRIDPMMIRGLDVALFNKAGFRLLDDRQNMPLRERSDRLDALICDRLFAADKPSKVRAALRRFCR
jgi:hypothetical protein